MKNNASKLRAPFHTVNSAKMDYLTLVEHDVRPPIAFKNRTYLDAWIKSHDLKCESLGRRNPTKDITLVHGKVFPPLSDDGLFYSQIWVNAKYNWYRNAIKYHVKNIEGHQGDIHVYDADHAVGRKRLLDAWPDAWVNLMLVENGINRSIGPLMEKIPLEIEKDQEEIFLNTECLLKILFKRNSNLSREKIGDYLKEAANHFILEIDTSSSDNAIYTFFTRENVMNILRDIGEENTPPIEMEFPVKSLIFKFGNSGE